jgi:hypothetical protein
MRHGVFRAHLASVAAVFVLVSLAFAAVPVHAADDSNGGQLAQVPTLSTQQLNSALTALSQGKDSGQLGQLLSQFQSQMSAGNYSAAASTLGSLQGLSSRDPGSVPPSLNALLQSLSVGSDGVSVNSNTLASQMSAAAATTGNSGESAHQLSVDMASLANLMKYVNSTLASELLQNSTLLSQSAFTGSGGSLGAAPVTLPGVSGFGGVSVPTVGTPSFGVKGISATAPQVPLGAFLVPIALVAAAVGLYYSRGRIARMASSRQPPPIPFLRRSTATPDVVGPVPSDPRFRVEYYFGRAVSLMRRRGVPKLESETHREFSAKCDPEPESPHVSTISGLYEKAKFSGEEVSGSDASLAAESFSSMEKSR